MSAVVATFDMAGRSKKKTIRSEMQCIQNMYTDIYMYT